MLQALVNNARVVRLPCCRGARAHRPVEVVLPARVAAAHCVHVTGQQAARSQSIVSNAVAKHKFGYIYNNFVTVIRRLDIVQSVRIYGFHP